MILLIFLFFFANPITSEKWDKFYFHTSIMCDFDHKPNFTYDIMFYEYDHFFAGSDDLISETYEGEALLPGGMVNRTYVGTINGDEDSGYYYEPYAYITHNCLLSKEPVTVSIYMYKNVEKCKIGWGDCHIYVYFDLTGLEDYEHREVRVEQDAH